MLRVVADDDTRAELSWQHTAASVHYGTATKIRPQRAQTLDAVDAANPQRFNGQRHSPPKLPTTVWINNPTINAEAQKKSEDLSQRPSQAPAGIAG
ncbi:MAG: hypothetical protein ACRDZ8_20815 [Acidimicrobiales bacterium]